MVSMPIPEPGQRGYDTIRNGNLTLRDVLEQLGSYQPNKHRGAHLDPDLDPDACDRAPGWLPCFGQCDAAQSHLRNQHVSAGDVILFFGAFRETITTADGLRWKRGSPKRHVLFGYLEIGRIVDVDVEHADLPWAEGHPRRATRRATRGCF